MLGDKELKRRYLIIYRKAMEEAFLEDPELDIERSPTLKSLRKNFHITREENAKIEERVRLRMEVNQISEEDYTGRLDYYNKLLSKDKKNEDAWVGKGESLYNLAQYQRAVKCFDKALEIDANFEEAWYYRGLSMTELDNLAEALECFDKAITLYPEYKEAWLGSALALNRGTESKKALACVNKALELDPKFLPSILGQLIVLLDLEDYQNVIDTADTALTIFPKNEEIILLKREAQKFMGVSEDALEPLELGYSLPEDGEAPPVKELKPEEGVEMSELLTDDVDTQEVISDEVITDEVFVDEGENIPVLEMVSEEESVEEPLQELEVLPEVAIYEPELQDSSEIMESEPVEDVLPSNIPESRSDEQAEGGPESGEEGPEDLGPGSGPVEDEVQEAKPKRARIKVDKKEPSDSGPIGPEEDEDAVEELIELQPLEPIADSGSMEFEDAEELVEEIIEEMESEAETDNLDDDATTGEDGASAEPAEATEEEGQDMNFEEADELVEDIIEEMESEPEADGSGDADVKEALEIDEAVPGSDETYEDMESSTKFESSFDSYEFSAEMEDVLVECRSCGDLIPDDVETCPICNAVVAPSEGAPPEAVPEPEAPAPQREPERPKPVKKERPSLLQLRKQRKHRDKPKRFRPRRLFAGIHKIHKLIKCPECGGPVAVPSPIRPIVVSCSQCGSYGKLV